MISEGARVKIHYKLSVDGELVDSSEQREPLAYVQGEGQIIAGLESHLVGLGTGDVTRVEVPPEEAYGLRNEDAIQTVPRDAFEDSTALEVGKMIKGTTLEGQSFSATVQKIGDDQVTLDLNHPLAGRTLGFEVEILEVIAPDGS